MDNEKTCDPHKQASLTQNKNKQTTINLHHFSVQPWPFYGPLGQSQEGFQSIVMLKVGNP